jgi:hypothetical protein
MPLAVDRALRIVNAAVALVTLASALAVLWSDVFVPGYREHYRDALWFVVTYAAVQAFMLVEFARGSPRLMWLALAKTLAAYAFLAGFLALWPQWRFWTPARYVYQVFAWDEESAVGLFALVFLGRGAFNTVNAAYYTRDGLLALRARRPLLGRLATAIPAGMLALCVWSFLALVREEHRSFSPEARDVARQVLATLECGALQARIGQATDDLRRRGEQTYRVHIAYGCPVTRVEVLAEDGRRGAASGARPDCCGPPA